MKILIIDMLSPKGHVNYNKGLIRILEKGKHSVTFIAQKDLVEELYGNKNRESQIIPNDCFLDYSETLSNNFFRPIIWRKRLINWICRHRNEYNRYDYVLFSSAEPFVISWCSRHIKTRHGFVDHGIGKVGESLLYKFCYKYLLNKNTDTWVLEEYIAEYVKNIINRKILVMYHPIFSPYVEKTTVNQNKQVILFAPSGGNDVAFVDSLISSSRTFPNNYKIIIKGRGKEYEDENVKVYSGHLNSDLYYRYFNESSAILIPYESTYNYRTSAIFFEAMAAQKPVLILDNNTLVQFASKFPKVTFLFHDISDIPKVMSKIGIIESSSYKEILEYYSDENILNQFESNE